ncbi:hypothetical protein D3C71_1756530 [compost metagenome]
MSHGCSKLADNFHFFRTLQFIVEQLQLPGIFDHLLMVQGQPAAENNNERENEHNQRPFPVEQIIIALADIIPHQLGYSSKGCSSEADGKNDRILISLQRIDNDTGNEENELKDH